MKSLFLAFAKKGQFALAALFATFMSLFASAASAGITDDAIAAINANKSDAMLVAGVVLALIASIAVVGIIATLLKRT